MIIIITMIIMIMIIMLMMMMILMIVVTKGAKCPQNFCQKRRFCNLENIIVKPNCSHQKVQNVNNNKKVLQLKNKTKLLSPKAQRRAAETQAATPVSSSVAVLNMLKGFVLNVRNVHRFWLLTCFTDVQSHSAVWYFSFSTPQYHLNLQIATITLTCDDLNLKRVNDNSPHMWWS